MGVLRSDRVSGLGGANAINGSVFFGTSDLQSNNQNLIVSNTSELDIGSGNFTIEYWFNCGDTSTDGFNAAVATTEYTNTSSNTAFNIYHYNKGFRIYNRASSSFPLIFTNDNSWTPSTWHHFAWVREGTGSSENKVYIDGSHIGSAFTNAADYTTGQDWLIGANFYGNGYGQPEYGFSGYLSNVRVSNVARYTVNFTAPTTRYEKDANTIILACQSPGNILKEETGKTLTPCTKDVNTAFPVASHIAPDKGEDYGTTFADGAVFDTLSYMVPPGGTTAQSNRGRAVMAGGMVYPTAAGSQIDYMEIQSGGITKDFGDLTVARGGGSAPMSSSTRGVIAGGLDGPDRKNEIDFITIATTGNATDFGNLSELLGYLGGVSNQTRGLICGGNGPSSPTNTNQIEYITIATTGDSQDFGQLNKIGYGMSGSGSPTRGLIFGGYVSPGFAAEIDYVTIATTGNATDFGDTTIATSSGASCSSATRALYAGGYNSTPAPSTKYNTIDYVTIASTGDATDFGDLSLAGSYFSATSNGTRGIFGSRMDNQPFTGNVTIDSVIIASTGNAVNWGDHHRMDSGPHDGQPLKRRTAATMSDSHGGIS